MIAILGVWSDIFPPESVSLTVLVLSLVAASGLALGSIRVKSVALGIPGVMFTGLALGRLLGPEQLNAQVLAFIRDFGLILFVYAVGMQVGPGFIASLRRRGLLLNLMAAAIVVMGAALSIAFAFVARIDIKAAVGLFAGGTTNAPALGSATEALKSLYGPAGLADAARLTSPAFAIAYPFGLVGVILAMILLRAMFGVQPQREAELLETAQGEGAADVTTLNVELRNPNLDGQPLRRIADLTDSSIVVSRVLQRGRLTIAKPDTTVALGDVLLAVGPAAALRDFQLIVGTQSQVDLRAMPSQITTRNVLVTHSHVLGRTVDELDLPRRLGVAVTRVIRSSVEFTAVGRLRLQFGDRVRVVGETQAIDAAAQEMGDSVRDLNLPRLLPIFIGIALGVVLGSLPVFVPGLPAPVKLGLASGPMIVAILLARIGRFGRLIWYMPASASSLLREMGIVLFLIAVGLQAGDGFFQALHGPTGLWWLLLGAAVTFLPLMIIGVFARVALKTNYLHICGLLAGSMTSPSLPFTNTMTTSEAPAVAFATVYPLTMILRVLIAQLIVLVFR